MEPVILAERGYTARPGGVGKVLHSPVDNSVGNTRRRLEVAVRRTRDITA
jgi:hypothetical protein